MKNIFLLIIAIASYSCKAQNAPLYLIDRTLPEGTHFKDLDNDLNKFVGTWKWQSNDSIITIVLQKKEDVFFNNRNQYEDYIIGEYKFEINGVVLIDYLYKLQDPTIIGLEHYLAGNRIMDKRFFPKCDECSINERRLHLYFTDPEYSYIPSGMVLRHKLINGIEQLHIKFRTIGSYVQPYENAPEQNRIPFGDYVFIKQ